jgi:hypothetical protein
MGFKSLALAISLIGSTAFAGNPACRNLEYKSASSVLVHDILSFELKKLDLFDSFSQGYRQACDAVSGRTGAYQPQDGDVIFLSIDSELYQRVAISTNTWVSHVGIAFSEKDRFNRTLWYVYESSPLYGHKTPLCEYVGKALQHRFAVARSLKPLTDENKRAMLSFMKEHYRDPYHLGFNYDAEGYQFCSKFVEQTYERAGISLGKFEPLSNLVDHFDEAAGLSGKFGPPMSKDQILCFWESYFGFCRDSGSSAAKLCENFGGDRAGDIDSVIPRHRMTVTPASQYFQALRGEGFSIVFDYRE